MEFPSQEYISCHKNCYGEIKNWHFWMNNCLEKDCTCLFDFVTTSYYPILFFQNGYTDVAFADLYIIPERKKYIDYTQPYSTDYVCFLVKKPPLNAKWQDLMIPFHKETWYAILITIVVCTLVVSIMNGIFLEKEFRPRDALLNILAIFLDESLNFTGKIK